MTRPSGPVNCTGSDFIATLVRYEGRPLGWLHLACAGSTVDGTALYDSALRTFGWDLAADSLIQPGGDRPDPPPISLVICTRDRAPLLERCLTHVARLEYPHFEAIVVDNAPSDESTREVAARFPVRYVREDRPGLDWGRNRGIAEARHGIVAFTDDDATPDAGWLNALAAGFENPAIMAVTGLVAPMELATQAQVLFEQVYGGMGKGMRGRLFHRDQMRPSQMIAIHALGVGANMAFRREALERLGGFDTALDVGTAACGGGDLDMFHRVIAAGMPLWYEPRALVWHQHRREIADLRRQLYNDGRSFAVYLLKLWRDRTVPRRSVARYAVWVWGRWLAGRVVLGALGRHRLPFSVLWANFRGAVDGPRAYLATYRHDRRLKKSGK
jgi:GT2 family glycosyltransferase